MNTDVEILVERQRDDLVHDLLRRAREQFEHLEQTFSRFRPTSELSRLNRVGRLRPSPQMAEVVRLALAARARTGGRFDPTVHDALVNAGYATSFDDLSGGIAPAPEGDPPPCGGRVEIDAATGEITLERGVHLDLGGIAKGFAVDRVRDLVGEAGPCLVNAGGDIAIGETPEDGAWNVGVERADGTTITIGLVRGGLATSGRDRRRWRTEAGEAHHIIDPGTSRPTGTDLLRVTAFGSSAVDAEVLAKSLLIAGRDDAIREADEQGIPCVLVDATGGTTLAGGLS